MGCLGNLLWFVFAGLWLGLGWIITGLVWCITIIGIPIGLQCFKFAQLAFFPFGKEVQYGNGFGSLLLNILWLIFGGFPLALEHLVVGCILCITIIGIPFGRQCFKMTQLTLMPFGATVRG